MTTSRQHALSSNDNLSLAEHMAQAIAAGADLADLEAIMADRGLIAKDEDGCPHVLLPAVDEAGDQPGLVESHGPLRSIMERANGDLRVGKRLAEWLLGKRAEQVAAQSEARLNADALIQQASDWRDQQVAKARGKIGWVDWLLERFLHEAGVTKLALIGGKPTLTPNKPRKTWDEKGALAFALERPDVDRLTKRELSKTGLNELVEEHEGQFVLKETGEVVGFVWLQQPETPFTFSVK